MSSYRRETQRSGRLSGGGRFVLGAHGPPENVRRGLDFPAANAGEVSAKARLEREHERVAAATTKPLADHVHRNRPHLWNRNRHGSSISRGPRPLLRHPARCPGRERAEGDAGVRDRCEQPRRDDSVADPLCKVRKTGKRFRGRNITDSTIPNGRSRVAPASCLRSPSNQRFHPANSSSSAGRSRE